MFGRKASKCLCSTTRLADLFGAIERGINDRTAVPQIIDKIIRDLDKTRIDNSSDASTAAFLIARVFKLNNRIGKHQHECLRRCLETVSFQVNLLDMNVSDLSKFLWACATLGVEPLLPETLGSVLHSQLLTTKDLCNLIWATSKWASVNNKSALLFFEHLLTFIDETRSRELSREDLVAISRAIANVHNR